jgi:GntR family transcriptional regulator
MSLESDLTSGLMEVWRRSVDAGLPLPPEVALAAELGVSRPTLREALVRMEASGLVRRHPSKGTFPNVLALEFPLRLDQSFEFAEVLESAGRRASVEVLESGWTTLSDDDAATLRMAPGASAFRTLKLWRADDRPVMMAEDLVPSRSGEVDPDPAGSVFETVSLLRGTTVEWEGAAVDPVLPAASVARHLDVAETQPLLRLSIVGVSRHGERLYLAREHHDTRVLPYGLLRAVV